jgi:LPXTG-motif cell wall-anchored protein
MKRLLIATVAAAAALTLSPVAVGAVPYGPSDPTVSLPTSTVTPGGSFTVTFFGFDPFEVITVDVSTDSSSRAGESFRAPRAVVGTVTADSEGTATVVIEAPSASGTYVITATGDSGNVATATFTVVASSGGGGGGGTGGGSLPATGSDSNQLVQTGGVVLALGAGLVGVAALRRRRTVTA